MVDTPHNPGSGDPSAAPNGGEASLGLDTARLNAIMHTALEPGVLFGRGLDLTDADRDQFGRIVDIVESTLAPGYEDPAWKEYEALVEEGSAKGAILSLTTHEGTNVNTWCVDGGADAEVKKIKRETEDGIQNGIQVPSRIFYLVHWHETAQNLNRYITHSNETLRHTSPAHLGTDLRRLASFVKRTRPQD